jgi:uncharacterized protein (DUF2141 family)
MGANRKTPGPTRRRFLASLFGALALLVLPPALGRSGAATPTTTLTVVVEGMVSDAGNVALALYDSRDAYRDGAEPVRKGRQEIVDGACTWVVEDLPPGDYALSAYHDVNDNGELDKGAFGIPSEPYGFSNDARGKTGRPGWDKVRFSVIAPAAELRVRVH